DMLNEESPPHFDEFHAVSLAIEALVGIVNALAVLERADSPGTPSQRPRERQAPSAQGDPRAVASTTTTATATTTAAATTQSTPNTKGAQADLPSSQPQLQSQSSQSSQTSQTSSGPASPRPKADPAMVREMTVVSWCPVLSALSFLLAKSHDESLNQ